MLNAGSIQEPLTMPPVQYCIQILSMPNIVQHENCTGVQIIVSWMNVAKKPKNKLSNK